MDEKIEAGQEGIYPYDNPVIRPNSGRPAASTKGDANESHTYILLVLSVCLCCFNDMLSLRAGARILGDRHRPTESANELPAETAQETASADSGARIRLGGRAGDVAQLDPRQAERSHGGSGCGKL